MIFSKKEMNCFNSIIDGKKIFNIDIQEEYENEEIYIEETIVELQKKKILDENRKITKEGCLPILALEKYKKCRSYIIINNLNIALLNDSKCVVIQKEDNGFRIYFSTRELIACLIVINSSFMKKKSNDNLELKCEKIHYINLINKYKNNYESLLVKWYFCSEPITEKIYSWDENKGFVYDLKESLKTELTPRKMRLSILDDLKIKYS